MPTFINPKRVTVDPRGFPLWPLVVVGAVIMGVNWFLHWLAPYTAELYAAIAVTAVVAVAVAVVVVRRQRFAIIKPGTVTPPRPLVAEAQRVVVVHHHYLHVSPASPAAAVEAAARIVPGQLIASREDTADVGR